MNKQTRILLVDDEQEFAQNMATILQTNGYIVQTADSAQSAIEYLKNERFDLVITDINMPGMDGIELMRQIRQIYPDQRIIIITGFPSYKSQEEAFKMGAIHYITKPFVIKQFLELISKSLNDAREE